MKSLRAFGILFLLLVGSAVFYWFLTKPEFPLDRTIVNHEGKSLEVTIQGKDPVKLQVDRRSDGERFEIPIESLGWKDRLVAMRLPNQSAPPKAVAVASEAPADPYIASREKELKKMRAKRDLFVSELKSNTLGEMLARKRNEDLLALQKEIRELEVAIEIRRKQTTGK